jgi:glucose-1-phosphatase
MAIRTLLFDLGNVLFYFSHDRMCAQIAQVCGVPDARLREILFGQGLQRQFERGELSEEAFHKTLQKAVGRSVDLDALRRAGSDIFVPNEELIALLDRWKGAGYRLVLLSNTCVTHYDWVRRHFDALERFDDFVLSYKVGAVKPEDAIFRTALQKIRCEPGECFYTDDITDYIARARSFGIQAETFVDVPTLVRQLERLGVACAEPKG